MQSEISEVVTRMLWGRSAARCQFEGCNRPLWKSSVTQESLNLAERAHIYAASDEGPRGNEGVSVDELNGFANLLLVCDECHKKLDKRRDGGRYSAELLLHWKATHEDRIARVTDIAPSKSSHIILYGAPVGDMAKPLSYEAAATALFPGRYPAEDRPISLQMVNASWRDKDEEFWQIEEQNLRKQFQTKVAPRLASGELGHVSLFGFAPQPLLVLFGALLTDIPAADVFQLQREPPGWKWDDNTPDMCFIVRSPSAHQGPPALVISLSATNSPDRIHRVLGNEAAIWELTVDTPHNDFLRARNQLRKFRETVRRLLDKIKVVHGQTTTLHIFPAMPVAAAIDLGRVRMPKADSPWMLYDQLNDKTGFVPVLRLGATTGHRMMREFSDGVSDS